VLWLGVAVIASSTLRGWQWVTMISPVFVAFLLTNVSGIPILEKRADERWGSDPAYKRYKSQTPVLLLRPPRR
jgi:steroid 5-alpha reductase family enzyme